MGEDRLIRLIARTVRPRGHVLVGIGDDACVLRDGTVMTTDAYAEGIHFDRSYMTMREIGQRCACAALSDIVAMAAEPEALLVALCVPPRATGREVSELYRGIEHVCRRLGCEVAGGDIIALDRLVLALTAAGRTRSPRLRSAARPGDTLYVTGHAGLAETGRLLLRSGRRGGPAVRRHLCPLPRVEAMRRLRPAMHALIDTSDGIATDARHLCEMSRVRIELDAAAIPVAVATRRLCRKRGADPVRFALSSGEDYELLFTSPRRPPRRVAGVPVTSIGRVKSGTGLFLEEEGRPTRLRLRGYDHLGRPS